MRSPSSSASVLLTAMTPVSQAGWSPSNWGGSITEFPVTAGAQPADMTLGPDGNLWFLEISGNKVGRMT